MFIEQAYKGATEGWKYILGVITVFIGWQFVGSLPLIGAIVVKSMGTGTFPTEIGEMAALLGSNPFLLLLIFSFFVGLLTLFFWYIKVHGLKFLDFTTTRKKVDYGRIGFGFLVFFILTVSVTALSYFSAPENFQWNFDPTKFFILCLIVIPLLPLQTSFEEYFLRAYMMQGLGVITKNRWVPLFFTSILFGLMHIFNPEVEELGYIVMVYYIGTGFLLGIMTLMDEGLELALGCHAGNNVVTALLVTSDWTALQTDSILIDISEPKVGIEIFFPIILYAIILLVMARKYKWRNWKDKLFGKVVKPA